MKVQYLKENQTNKYCWICITSQL